ncbi:MAG: SPFH domain-containing protein [Candidatus Omnitrophota bacterium]
MQNEQGLIFKGIYEFEDPLGVLVAAKVPSVGTLDLYSGTAVLVKANQCALFIYNGKIADILMQGLHEVKTENFPLLTRLANWQFGFESPLRCEVWFFSGAVYTNRRWGTSQPVICDFPDHGIVPVRAYGIFNVVMRDPNKFFMTLIGTRNAYDITELEGLVQAQITEILPAAMHVVPSLQDLNKSQTLVAKELQGLVNKTIEQYGIEIVSLQVISMIPSKEIMEALDAKASMNIIGNKQEYLLYKAANSLIGSHEGGHAKGSSDSMQLMMGLMLGKSLLDAKEKEHTMLLKTEEAPPMIETRSCSKCKAVVKASDKFCASCGTELK